VALSPEARAAVLRLYHAEKWPVGTIASELGVHHGAVTRVLRAEGLPPHQARPRPMLIDPFLPFVQETLARHPALCASRLFRMVKERGYPGGEDHFRDHVARLRPRQAEAFLRLRTLPGEQAQVDWAHFGHLTVGRAKRPLWAFVMVLSSSRRLFVRFALSAAMPSFLRGHVEAFAAFGGAARVVLYDNLKSAVLERAGEVIRFHPTLLALAGHYRYEPRPCNPARGNEKGRVERAIQYLRTAFFAARPVAGLDRLNAEVAAWTEAEAQERRWPEDRSRTVADAFADERPKLLAPPDAPFETDERVEVAVGKTPYVRFDLNDYSIPHTHVRRTLVVRATEARVRVLDGATVLAEHTRSWGRDEQVEDASHLEALRAQKRRGREGATMGRLWRAAPSSKALCEQVAERGGNVGAAVFGLQALVERHGAEAVEAAAAEALARGAPSLGSVRLAIDRARHARGLGPAVSVPLPASARGAGLAVTPHALGGYDALGKEEPCPLPSRRPTPSRCAGGRVSSVCTAWSRAGTRCEASRGSSASSRSKRASARAEASSVASATRVSAASKRRATSTGPGR
jgi:transposase